MVAKTEGTHAGEHVVSEANGGRSRETVTVLSGQSLAAGQVLGRIVLGAAAAAAFAGNTGDGVLGAVAVAQGAKPGLYKLVVIEPAANAGKFSLEDPDGVVIGTGTVAVAFSAGGIGFTLADGAADFIAGDGFTIAVAAGSGKVRALHPASAVGADTAAGVLFDAVDASAADKVGVAHLRDAEILASSLVWPAGITDNQKTVALAQLATLGLIAR